MVKRPQHTLQIMEPQTRFDLNIALQHWREELAAQASLTAEDRRELEAHLNDTVAELRGRGLSDQEAFWLACRRVGQPEQLAQEFAKDNPASVWRQRVFWLAAGLLGMRLWMGPPAYFLEEVPT